MQGKKGAEEYRVTYESDAEAIFGPLYAYSADKDKMMELRKRLLSSYMGRGITIEAGEEKIYTLDSEKQNSGAGGTGWRA